jgi:cytochrome P450
MHAKQDPFRQEREGDGIKYVQAEGQNLPLVLRLHDIRKVCKDWQTFSSDDPFRIVLHSEADVRSVRQLPIETDPPDHPEYRALVEPFFRKAQDSAYQADMQHMVDKELAGAVNGETCEAVHDLAVPVQSRSLARLMGLADSEADLWISWGTHVFREGDGATKGAALEQYIHDRFEAAEGADGEDFFSVLNRAEYRGRKLTTEEKHGFANLIFAAGRDTVIHTISGIVAHLAQHREALDFLREDRTRIRTATEEFVRYVSPLTAIARKCPHGAEVRGHAVPPGGRVGLCWPSANRDEQVFDKPDDLVLDRSPNPHVGFGFGKHHCLGAPQARLVIRCLLNALCDQVSHVELIEMTPDVEHESSYSRQIGYQALRVKFQP